MPDSPKVIRISRSGEANVGGAIARRDDGFHDLLDGFEEFGGKLIADQFGEALTHDGDAWPDGVDADVRAVEVTGQSGGDAVDRCLGDALTIGSGLQHHRTQRSGQSERLEHGEPRRVP